MPERITFESSRALRDAVVTLAHIPGVPEPERRELSKMLGRRPDEQEAENLRATIRRHRALLVPELVASALGIEVAPDVPAPCPTPAPSPERAPRKRGRPPTGKALSGAERARLWRQRHAVTDVQVPQALAVRIRTMASDKGLVAADLVAAAVDVLAAPAFSRVTRDCPGISGVPVVFGLVELSKRTGMHPLTLERQLHGSDAITERALRAKVPELYLPALARGEAVPVDETTCFDGPNAYRKATGPKGTAFIAIPLR